LPKCVSIPAILLFVNQKSYHFKTALHLKRAAIGADKVKNAGILCVLRVFLPQCGANMCLFQAIYHYGAPPKGKAH
jgi:hypothetical protein